MYDTVNIRKELAGDQLSAILNRLENITKHENSQWHKYTGYLDNYKVTVNPESLWLTGSLAKFHLGDNISTLTRSETARAIEHLSDEIGVSMENAKVTGVDLAANMLMKHRPEEYYPFLLECPNYSKVKRKSSLYFEGAGKTMIFYNKIKEAIAKHVTIPEVVQGGNLLRYELRLKDVNQKLNADVTLGLLSNERLYMDVVRWWHTEYKKILKQHSFTNNIKNMKTPKDYWSQKDEQAIHLIGLDAALREVDQLKAMQAFAKPEYYSRLRRQIREKYSQEGKSEVNSYIQELDQKIERMAKHFH